MTPELTRRMLIVAIALSVLIHLLGVRLVHWSIPTPQEASDTTTISRVVIIHHLVRPLPKTLKPTPVPTPARPRVNPKTIAVPHVAGSAGSPARRQIPVATAPPPTPVPRAPSPLPSRSFQAAEGCAAPNAPAALKTLAPAPEMPIELRRTAKAGATRIHLTLSDTGAVLDAGILSSSGNDGQDQLALTQAKQSAYAPALAQCKAVAGSYDFTAKFVIP